MPQLDAASFLSQVTWLTLFFGIYYRVGLNYILPTLAGRLKTRAKKVTLSKGRVSGFDGERVTALSGYDTIVGNSCSWLTQNLTSAMTEGENWRNKEVRTADSNGLLKGNSTYLDAISNTRAQRVLVSNVTK